MPTARPLLALRLGLAQLCCEECNFCFGIEIWPMEDGIIRAHISLGAVLDLPIDLMKKEEINTIGLGVF